MKKRIAGMLLVTVMMASALTACGNPEKSTDAAVSAGSNTELNAEIKPATQYTIDANQKVYALLDFEDTAELENAKRGFLAAPDTLDLHDENGKAVWTQNAYAFLDKDAPDTANPSLWRNAQLNHIYGLFEVTDGIYQVRGYDLSNITFVRSDHGWIIMDCGSSKYTAGEALKLFRSKMGDARIVAVVVSHAHVDHYGGIEGLIAPEDVADRSLPLDKQIASGKTAIIVPKGYADAVMKENIFVGTAMKRRAFLQYGSMLPYGEQGRLSVGIGLTSVQNGIGYIAPSYEVTEPIFETTIDGVRAIFQQTPGTESPAEMNTYFPDSKALWMAENCSGTMHNLYTLRGAEVRDANSWARYITESQSLFPDAEVVFQAHNWPHWGKEVVSEYLTNTAAVYKFIHDQTLLYINEGYTSTEIASIIQLPEDLEKIWYTRQYYGTLKHNVKAVYQKYMGWYDANPIHLDELEPSEYAKKLVKYLGDTDKVLEMARADYEKGEYQWVAQITNTLVFADPENREARCLCADALEQLGYQAESGAWRNAYLSAAFELRNGTEQYPKAAQLGVGTTAQGMDAQTMLDYMGIVLDTEKLQDRSFTINLKLTDGDDYLLKIHHGILLYYKDALSNEADLTISTPRIGILAITSGNQENIDKLITVENGDAALFQTLCDSMNAFDLYFNIIEP